MDISILISIIGLAVALVALYFSQFQPAKFEAIFEGEIRIYYPENGGVAFLFP